MGNIICKYIIVSGNENLEVFWNRANEIFEGYVTNIVTSPVDSEIFLIVPDGGKSGFDTSNLWEEKIKTYKQWFKDYCCENEIYSPKLNIEIHYCNEFEFVKIVESNIE